MFRYMHSKRKSGFTLLELIVVMAVIAILVAMGVPRFIGYTKDAAVTAMQADCKVLEDACMIYNLENDGKWPLKTNGEAYEEATVSGALETFLGDEPPTLYNLDDAKFGEHVRSLKHAYSDFALDTDTGMIYFIGNDCGGIEGRDGKLNFGIGLKGDPPAGE